MWFQHDGVPAHFGADTRNALDTAYPGRWIGRGGPPRRLRRGAGFEDCRRSTRYQDHLAISGRCPGYLLMFDSPSGVSVRPASLLLQFVFKGGGRVCQSVQSYPRHFLLVRDQVIMVGRETAVHFVELVGRCVQPAIESFPVGKGHEVFPLPFLKERQFHRSQYIMQISWDRLTALNANHSRWRFER
ncbi:uncharacterized protein TNCV_2925361 [Trichonephila clavipes]|nr:uncharacterized protein TNCV_2925361 [Trichonephila clavipes]